MLLSPGTAKATVNGGSVTVACTTAYPFLDELSYTITAAKAFDFYVRVPAWAGSASSITVNKGKAMSLSPDFESGLQKVSIGKGKTTMTYTIDSSKIITQSRANDTVAVYKGALLYALEISNRNTSTLPQKYNDESSYYPSGYAPPQSRDWQYHNTSAWNFAIDPTTLKYHGPNSNDATYELANPIFGPGATPGYMTVQACEIEWPMFMGVPGYPPTGNAKKCIGKSQTLRMIPYGSAKTHMAELPVMS